MASSKIDPRLRKDLWGLIITPDLGGLNWWKRRFPTTSVVWFLANNFKFVCHIFCFHTGVAVLQYLPPANEVWGMEGFHKHLSFCPGGGVLASQHASQVTWPGGICIWEGGRLHPGEGGWAHNTHQILRDTVNNQAVRILLECILFIMVDESWKNWSVECHFYEQV